MFVTIKKAKSKDVEIPRVSLIVLSETKEIFIQIRGGMRPPKNFSIASKEWDEVSISKMQ